MPSATLWEGFYRILLVGAKKLKDKNYKSDIQRVNVRRALKRRELTVAKNINKTLTKIKYKKCKLADYSTKNKNYANRNQSN